MDRSGWIDAKTHRRDGACSASVSSDSSASEVLVLISIAQTSPSQLQAQNSSNNIICWRGDLRPKSPLFPSATLHCSSLSLFVSLPVVSNPGKYLRNQLGCKINWMTIQGPLRPVHQDRALSSTFLSDKSIRFKQLYIQIFEFRPLEFLKKLSPSPSYRFPCSQLAAPSENSLS